MPRENATQPAWAPDGLSLLFRANRPPFSDTDIWEMDPEGGDQRLVAHLPGEQLYPSYSPDKSRIAYTSPVGGDRGIFTAAADGSDVRTVFNAPGVDDSAPNWSPDGRRIAFESAIDGDGEIYVIDADGDNLRQLTHNTIHDEGPSWSPDGQRIVFTSGPGNLEGDIWVMNADGSGRTRITDSPGRDESPDWQPVPHAGDYSGLRRRRPRGSGRLQRQGRRRAPELRQGAGRRRRVVGRSGGGGSRPAIPGVRLRDLGRRLRRAARGVRAPR